MRNSWNYNSGDYSWGEKVDSAYRILGGSIDSSLVESLVGSFGNLTLSWWPRKPVWLVVCVKNSMVVESRESCIWVGVKWVWELPEWLLGEILGIKNEKDCCGDINRVSRTEIKHQFSFSICCFHYYSNSNCTVMFIRLVLMNASSDLR